jgi:hypothetical protein
MTPIERQSLAARKALLWRALRPVRFEGVPERVMLYVQRKHGMFLADYLNDDMIPVSDKIALLEKLREIVESGDYALLPEKGGFAICHG